jgi:hypothetical protein
MFWNKKGDKKSLPDLPPVRRPSLIEGNRLNLGGLPGQEQMHDSQHESQQERIDEPPFEMERHDLPSFPDSMHEKGFSQSAIKDAVGDTHMRGLPVLPDVSSRNEVVGQHIEKPVDLEEWQPSQPIGGQIHEIGQSEGIRLPETMRSGGNQWNENKQMDFMKVGGHKKNEDVFVKLDKFYSARKALIDAQQKVKDVDELLKKIRETKMREEQELAAWERDLMLIKTRMNDVTVNLFEKVD